ncbi:hypothetical protein TNCV_255231 [Trichonephila clavipes]|nr:hypothetical protein TNCV_255231 [Trichonephila clavipes]
MQASHLRFMERRTFDNISGVFRIFPAAALMRSSSSSALFTGVSLHEGFHLPPKEINRQERSGDRGRQCTGPPRKMPIHRSPHVASRNDPGNVIRCAHEWLLWVLKIQKDASSVNNTEAAKRDLQFVAASTSVKRPDEVQSHILLVTRRAGSEMDAGHYHRESSNATV